MKITSGTTRQLLADLITWTFADTILNLGRYFPRANLRRFANPVPPKAEGEFSRHKVVPGKINVRQLSGLCQVTDGNEQPKNFKRYF
jgi:hypothetical protein